MFTTQVVLLSILITKSQVVSLNHFGSRIKHKHIYGELVCKEFSTEVFLIAFNGDYMLPEIVGSSFIARGRLELIKQLNIFPVLRSQTLFRSHNSFGERVISFERADTNHDKVASPKQQWNEASIYTAHNSLRGCEAIGVIN